MIEAGLFDDLPSLVDEARRRMGRRTRNLVAAAAELADTPATIEHADFLHTILCQVGLPRRRVEAHEFRRISGDAELIVQGGYIQRRGKLIAAPVPYGARPRLVLIHVTTQAVRYKTRTIKVGNTIRQFMLALGLDPDGREYREFQRQVEALAACRLILGSSYGTREVTLNVQPFDRFEAWLTRSADQLAMWPGVLELSEQFYESLRESAVPLSHDALAVLKGSSLALDVYAWLAHRLWRVRRPAGEKVSWGNLREQFGQEYRDPKNFKREFRVALRQALAVYPSARLDECTAGGLLLLPSAPPVPRRLIAGARL